MASDGGQERTSVRNEVTACNGRDRTVSYSVGMLKKELLKQFVQNRVRLYLG